MNENSKNASAFDIDSFASFEKPSGVPAVPNNDTAVQSTSPDIPKETAEDLPSGESGASEKAASTESGASSFGVGSFASFEKKDTPLGKEEMIGANAHPNASPAQSSTGYRYPYTGYTPTVTVEKSPTSALDIFGWITFVACFPCGFIGLIVTVVSFFVGRQGAILPLAILFCLAASSIVVGVLLNKKSSKKSGIKNLVVGTITAFFLGTMLLSCFGNSTPIIDDDDSARENDEILIDKLFEKANLISGIDFSCGESAYVYDDTKFGGDYITLTVDNFDDHEELYGKIKSNQHFINVIPNELIGLLQEYDRAVANGDLYLIYNLDTEQYNCYPESTGEYNMLSITVSYYDEAGRDDLYVQITEYKLNYVKASDTNNK